MVELPSRGVVFWPVGEGDSTTVVVDTDGDEKTIVQIDIHNLECADDEDDPRVPIVDQLVEVLPKTADGRPYLAAFGLTHADEDHCLGFAELLENVVIGDLWFSPYILRDEPDLCDDAEAFCKEARRRIKKNIDGDVGSGDRVRVIGYHDLLKEEQYVGLPEECLTPPGSAFSAIDGREFGDVFRVFVHGPVGSEDEIERNDTSLAMQVTVAEEGVPLRLLLLGDLAYPGVKRVFDEGEDDNLAWNVLLAPHHCSRSVFYFAEGDEKEPTLKDDLVDVLRKSSVEPAWAVASCGPVPSKNQPGDDPPHADALARYEEIASEAVLVTGEHPNVAAPEPVRFEVNEGAVMYLEPTGQRSATRQRVSEAVIGARGAAEPPRQPVGFGGCR
jgi:hypothetical protein